MYTGNDIETNFAENNAAFELLSPKAGYVVPELLKHLALAPVTGDYSSDRIYVRNYGTRIAQRGGFWGHTAGAGIFSFDLRNTKSQAVSGLGFRSSFIS